MVINRNNKYSSKLTTESQDWYTCMYLGAESNVVEETTLFPSNQK